MFKFGSMCLLTCVLCAAGGALAADGPKNQVIPDFAPTYKTGWVLDRAIGVDDLLPPPTGGPAPVPCGSNSSTPEHRKRCAPSGRSSPPTARRPTTSAA